MKIERSETDGVVVIGPVEAVEVNFDNCDAFREGFEREVQLGDRHVVLDATRIGFFDSAGMSALLSLQKGFEKRDGELVLAGLNPSVNEVFRMVGFDVLFRTFPDVTTAAGSFDE